MEKFTAAPENTMATSPVGDEGKLMDASLTATYAWCDADVKALLEKV